MTSRTFPAMTEEEKEIRDAVATFARRMVLKMLSKIDEGKRGWNDPAYEHYVKSELLDHFEQDDWLDVANFAMILDYMCQKKGE